MKKKHLFSPHFTCSVRCFYILPELKTSNLDTPYNGHAALSIRLKLKPKIILCEILTISERTYFSYYPTLPWSMSSLCAAEAAFTSAEFAAAMDFAASKIISSKLRFSSASCQQKHNPISPILQ
jgi:hypothetical protein